MAKISVHLGFTFRVGPLDTNQYARVDLTADEIDSSLPLEPQLEEIGDAADKVWEFVRTKVDTQIDNIIDSPE
jgi:hypothetical protein|tara:strand:+ start:17110 stop:17328 length:219 start_codon:yes stop_codon:yes gene_type:complete